MTRLDGHVALITGAARGIGAAIATRLHEEGAAIVITDANVEGAHERAATLGDRAIGLGLDVRDREAWATAVEAASEAFGAVDILVNNAGMLRDRSLVKMSDEEWGSIVDVHLKGAWLGMQHVFPAMKDRGWGRIVSMSSISANGTYGQANYAAAKAGLIGLTKTAALEGAKYGITANCIAPGVVRTNMYDNFTPETLEGWRATIPVGRFGEPRDIAAIAAFLASDDASYVTGQVITADGGQGLG